MKQLPARLGVLGGVYPLPVLQYALLLMVELMGLHDISLLFSSYISPHRTHCD